MEIAVFSVDTVMKVYVFFIFTDKLYKMDICFRWAIQDIRGSLVFK